MPSAFNKSRRPYPYSNEDNTNRNFEQFLNCLQPQFPHLVHDKKLNKKLNTKSFPVIFNKT